MNEQDNIFNFSQKHSSLMLLKIFVDFDEELTNIYKEAVNKHNSKVLNDPFPDSGFDLFLPKDVDGHPGALLKINFGIKCSAKLYRNNGKDISNTAFYLYPRSSLSKTQLRLANSVGIIDSAYRGNLIGVFDCKQDFQEDGLKKYNRLLQICAPSLEPIYVIMVNSAEELGMNTTRGEGGFGSTGK